MFKAFFKAARLRTLPLSVSGIIVGCALANFTEESQASTNYTIFILALLTTIAFQVLSNFANDYGDGIKGTDSTRLGEQRLVASGVISPKQMKLAVIIMSIISFLLALWLVYTAFENKFLYIFIFMLLGLLSIAAAINYTVGKTAYGYSGLGDFFVFIFFGLLSVLGSYFLYTKSLNWDVVLPACSIGLLSTAVLSVNNLRDIEEDIKHNKLTLAVKLGKKRAKIYHYSLIVSALITSLVFVFLNYQDPKQFLFLVSFIPLFRHLFVVAKNSEPRALDSELKKVSLSTFAFAILFSIFN